MGMRSKRMSACITCYLFMMMLTSSTCRAFISTSRSRSSWKVRRSFVRQLGSARDGSIEVDEEGRRIRKRVSDNNEGVGGGDWDDFDPFDSDSNRGGGGGSFSSRNRDGNREGNRGKPTFRSNNNSGGGRGSRRYASNEKGAQDLKINLKALEGAGFEHLYGLSSVLNALKADTRDFRRPEDDINLEDLDENDLHHEMQQRERKPQAQYSTWLFCQERSTQRTSRSTDKAAAAQQVEKLAAKRNIPIARVDKGVLNTLCHNRPHQGFVLRCGKLFFEPLSRIPRDSVKTIWLVLDEVVDPQNLGALIRSAYFMSDPEKLGILVCAKNSAPPSPVVSAASAGALELLEVHSTSNLPRTLSQAREDGFRIVGAAAAPPSSDYDLARQNGEYFDLQDFIVDDSRPTLLVLGSEGHGLRNLVSKACTDFVRIPPGVETADGVDSLNVSVTGGILLWHLLHGSRQP